MMTNLTKMILSISMVIVTAGVIAYFVIRKRRKATSTIHTGSNAPIVPSVVASSGGGSGGGSVVNTGYTLSITTARSANWWPHTWSIALNESQGSIKNFTLTFKQGNTVISSRTVANHNSFVTAFLTFVPFNEGIFETGNYTVEVSTSVGGTAYTASANFVIASQDLPAGYALNTSVIRDPQWWPFSQRIKLNETIRGTRDYLLTFKTANGTTISSRTVTALNTASVPFCTFTPTNEGITTQGTYQVTVSVVVSGTTYTHTSTFSLNADDFAAGTGSGTTGTGTTTGNTTGWTEPTDPNADVEMMVSPTQITGRFKISAGSGNYNATVKKSGATIATSGNLAYGTYVECTINRFYNQEDLAGQTLTWEFEKNSVVTSITFFTPQMVTREYEPRIVFNGQNVEYPDIEDRILQIRYTKPFNSARIKLEDVGENLGMVGFYYKNGSIYRDNNGNFNASILSPRPVPAFRHIQIIKYLMDGAFGNINDPNNSLFYGNQSYNKQGARLEFWVRTAANQTI